MILLHIIEPVAWEAAQAAGEYAPPSLAAEGFIHFSKPEQIPFVANTYFRGHTGLLVLVVDTDKLTASYRFDDVPGHGTFPHLYGPLNLDSVVTVLPFDPEEAETFTVPEAIPVV